MVDKDEHGFMRPEFVVKGKSIYTEEKSLK